MTNMYRALRAYDGEAARQYDAVRFAHRRGRIVDALEWRLLRRCFARLQALGLAPSSVLDVPVGSGRMAARMTALGYSVTAVDASEDMLRVSSEKRAAQVYLQGRSESLPIADCGVDITVSVRLFGHLPSGSKQLTLREIHRVSRFGAIVFYARDTSLLRVRRRVQARRGRQLGHWAPMTTASAVQMAQEAGFLIVDVMPLYPMGSETAAMVLVKAPGRTGESPPT